VYKGFIGNRQPLSKKCSNYIERRIIMSVGIVSYGAYIPRYRLSRDAISKAWGTVSLGGERAVANYDEDSLAMALEASSNCLRALEICPINSLFLASTTLPFKEKQTSGLISTIMDLGEKVRTADFSNSLRSGTIAMLPGLDAIKSGSVENTLVTAADSRLAEPGWDLEQNFGDGAAALLLGKSDIIATIEDFHTVSTDFTDYWRTDDDPFVRSGESAFIQKYGYTRIMSQTIRELLTRNNLQPKDFTKAVFFAPDPRSITNLAKSLGFELKTQIQDPLFQTIGNTGSAMPLILLVAALEEAKPGDRIIFASYGDGADAFILQVTEEIGKISKRRGLKYYLKDKSTQLDYEKYLRFRNLTKSEVMEFPTNLILLWRENKQNLNLYGSRCKTCQDVQFPKRYICYKCGSNGMEDVKLSRTGKVFTFTMEMAVATPDPPVINIILDFDSGGRLLLQMTDCNPGEVAIGMPVELTFRKFYKGNHFYNYFWKARPLAE
jgi:3-hydroxy-3-methylglutaryl CoA synthase